MIDPVRSHNTEKIHDRFFLVDEAAQQETDISLINWNFPARVGNDVAFCWLIPQDQKRGPFVYGINYTLNKNLFAKNKLPRFNLLYRSPFKFFRFVFSIIIGVFFGFLFSNGDYSPEFTGFTVLYFFLGALMAGGIFTSLTKLFFASAINKGIAAEQQMREDIRRLCREALVAEQEV